MPDKVCDEDKATARTIIKCLQVDMATAQNNLAQAKVQQVA